MNEDRFHVDEARGLFIVIDGVGGQAAGGKAADVALAMLRERLERETGPVAERVREAIAVANNEIYRLASSRPEWDGMACVLTVAVVKDGTATIGHVGDTRLYKLRAGRIEKITRDHSPVGEREDAQELSEFEAMRHPRRNEVYRDVGSEPHAPGDPEFVDMHEIPFDADDALLLCSDGLSDLVDSGVHSPHGEGMGRRSASCRPCAGRRRQRGRRQGQRHGCVCRRRKLRGVPERISREAGRISCSRCASFGQFHDAASWRRALRSSSMLFITGLVVYRAAVHCALLPNEPIVDGVLAEPAGADSSSRVNRSRRVDPRAAWVRGGRGAG